ncbi:MAG: trypsin-like peptidase domain-containing protein [Oscillospiraceae bacterium]|nr:trypsin-like peptidase domain-containing protein [Oscillospiraceae bacterium]
MEPTEKETGNSSEASDSVEITPETVPQDTESKPDGEYHYVRPERRLYEDAEFEIPGESVDIPQYYVPEEKKPREKTDKPEKSIGFGFRKIACLCLVCALLGGFIGGGAVLLLSRDNEEPVETIAPTAAPILTGASGSSVSSSAAGDVYALGCQQVVGITSTVNYTNFIGQTYSVPVSGSGFVVTADGYIVTNYHVIEYAYEGKTTVTVMFKDGTAYEAAIVGVEPDNDIAVLKIDASGLVPASVGDSSSIKVGDTVYAIGNPLGELDFSMTTGSVSALDRSISTEVSDVAINMFQFDAAVNSGNSGGPVYNTSGQVIGIVTAKSAVDGTEGLGFAIPINDAVEIANELITKGYVSGKPYLGVNIDVRYTSVYAEYYGMPEGAYIYGVEPGSCAETAGLCPGDVITSLGGITVKSYSDLSSAIRQFKAGETAEIVVYRSNDSVTLTVTFDESKPNTDNDRGTAKQGYSS